MSPADKLLPVVPPPPIDLLAPAAPLQAPNPAPAPAAPMPIPIPIPGAVPEPAAAQHVVTVESLGLAAEGQIDALGLPRLLYLLHVGTFSGTLKLVRRRLTRAVYFAAGFVLRVDSHRLAEGLGQMLLEQQIITHTQYLDAQACMFRRLCQMGEALLETGALDAEALARALRLQTELKLQNCLAYVDGNYRLEAAPATAGTKAARVHPLPSLWHGVIAHYGAPALAAYFAPFAQQFIVPQPILRVHLLSLGALLRPLGLAPSLNGATRVEALVGSGHSHAAALYILLVTDMVRLSPSPVPEAAIAASLLN